MALGGCDLGSIVAGVVVTEVAIVVVGAVFAVCWGGEGSAGAIAAAVGGGMAGLEGLSASFQKLSP